MSDKPRPETDLVRSIVALVVGATVWLGAPATAALACTPEPSSIPPHGTSRPPLGGLYSFGPYSEQKINAGVVWVHYTTQGPDAPPPLDLTGPKTATNPRGGPDGIPDYVEVIAGAAEKAIAFYTGPDTGFRHTEPFRLPPCDTAGPDNRPDIYVKALGYSNPGIALSQTTGSGGAFVLISNHLDDPSATKSYRRYGILEFTVAHELFHLVQYAYAPTGLPKWIAEGTAQALAFWSGDGDMRSLSLMRRLENRWWVEPWSSFYDQGLYCERCYGGGAFWSLLSGSSSDPNALVTAKPALAGDFLQRLFLAFRGMRSAASVTGVDQFSELWRKDNVAQSIIFETKRKAHVPRWFLKRLPAQFWTNQEFSIYCNALYSNSFARFWSTLGPRLFATIASRANAPALNKQTLNGFSCQYVRLKIPPNAAGLVLTWGFDRVIPWAQPSVELHLDGTVVQHKTGPDVRFASEWTNTKDVFTTGGVFKNSFKIILKPRERDGLALLTISSGFGWPMHYTLYYGVIDSQGHVINSSG